MWKSNAKSGYFRLRKAKCECEKRFFRLRKAKCECEKRFFRLQKMIYKYILENLQNILDNIFLYFQKLFKLYLRLISHSSPGGGIKWKMPEIILISRGDSDWPPGLLLQSRTRVVYSVPNGTLSEGLRYLFLYKILIILN